MRRDDSTFGSGSAAFAADAGQGRPRRGASRGRRASTPVTPCARSHGESTGEFSSTAARHSGRMPPRRRIQNSRARAAHADAPAKEVFTPVFYDRDPAVAAEVARLRELDRTAAAEAFARAGAARYGEGRPIRGNHINKAYEMRDGEVAEVYKPHLGQHKRKERAGVAPETQWQREIAASQIARELGISLLPPTRELVWEGVVGSAQMFREDMVSGAEAMSSPCRIAVDRRTGTPADLPDRIAEDWQLLDDLLLHGDRHKRNYLLRLDEGNKVVDVALIDNGLSLSADPSATTKRKRGPREGAPIGPLNQERLHQLVERESGLTEVLSRRLEAPAIAGFFARAKALLARGLYGNFSAQEIEAHLPEEIRSRKEGSLQISKPKGVSRGSRRGRRSANDSESRRARSRKRPKRRRESTLSQACA